MAVNCRVLKGGLCEITQYYGGENNHIGIDVVGANYTLDAVVAHSAGTVVLIQTGQVNNQGSTGNASYGNFVKISHGNGCYTLYAHLNNVDVKVGQNVSAGEQIGYMGNTGNSYGAHLHFEVWKDNVRVNPLEYLDKDLFESVTNPVDKDRNKNQLMVNVIDLRVRNAPSLSSSIIGVATMNAFYNYYETTEADGYTWYRIDDNQWIANKDNWLTIYPKQDTSNNEEIQVLKDKIILLEKENKELKEMTQDLKSFKVTSDGIYYIRLNKDTELLYKIKD